MTEAQERNLIRFVIGNSTPLDEMYEGYIVFCREKRLPSEVKDLFTQTIIEGGYSVVVIEGKGYVFGALEAGKTRLKPTVYARNTPAVEQEEFQQWMDEHAWKPEL